MTCRTLTRRWRTLSWRFPATYKGVDYINLKCNMLQPYSFALEGKSLSLGKMNVCRKHETRLGALNLNRDSFQLIVGVSHGATATKDSILHGHDCW